MPKPQEPPTPRDPQPRSPAPSIDPVFTWPTPGREDLLFYVERNGDLPINKNWAFGDSYRGQGDFPDHKLIYVSPQSAGKWSRWFYASDRINQDTYNFEFTGDQLARSFLVLRDKYYARTEAEALAANPPVESEFTRPVVATADTRFTKFVYAEDALSRTETEMDSIYILVRQIYVPERLVTYQWDDVLQRVIKVTRQVVPAQSEQGSGTYGIQVEIQPNNIFNDFKITSEVVWLPADLDGDGNPNYPIQIDSVAGDANYTFPLLLKSIEVFGAWAYATSEAPPDYSEDFFFELDLVEPSPGPYDATILRFVTDDPEAVRALYPTAKITSRAETFGMIRWWAAASDDGNRTFALARQEKVPATIHGEIELPSLVNYVQGGSRDDAFCAPGSESLPATPDYAAFIASTTTIAGVDTRRSRLGLWEVQVTRLNAGGATIYNDSGSARPLRAGTGTGNILGHKNQAVQFDILPRTNGLGVAVQIAGGVLTFNIWGPNPMSWVSNSAWLTLDAPAEIPASGYAAWNYNITYGANGTGSPRVGNIVFTDNVTGALRTYQITQPG